MISLSSASRVRRAFFPLPLVASQRALAAMEGLGDEGGAGGGDAEGYTDSGPDEDIRQDDSWTVISAYFEEKGLVRQQLDSFNEFLEHSLQEIVEETADVEVTAETKVLARATWGDRASHTRAPQTKQGQIGALRQVLSFGQLYLAQPGLGGDAQVRRVVLSVCLAHGPQKIFPNEARLRNLHYACALRVDMTKTTYTPTADQGVVDETETIPQVKLGHVPIMLRSSYCWTQGLSVQELSDLGECPYDQGGYFILRGSEKVLIAQENMAKNQVYVFKKPPGLNISHFAEVRSTLEQGARPTSTMRVHLVSKTAKNWAGAIRVTMPYMRDDIPLFIVFRALGFVSDKVILEHILYDLRDSEVRGCACE